MKSPLNYISKQKNILFLLILIVIFINIIFITPPIKQAFEYTPDEGTDLMKALLFQKGFGLYTEIWNDQPPLFTVIISFWLKLFGTSIQKARLLGTFFSIILLFALHQIVKIKNGRFCAFLTIILLLSSSAFLRLSAGLILGMAAFSFAMVSILFAIYYEKFPKKGLLSLSGIFMALSLQIKLYALFLIPLILLEIIFFNTSSSKNKKFSTKFSPTILWFSSFLIVYLGIIIIFFKNNFSLIINQLIAPHAAGITVGNSNFSLIWKMLLADYGITLLALISAYTIILKKTRKLLFPLLWVFSALIILMIHKPIWHHYYIFISIPFSWLAAAAISEFFHIGILKSWIIKKNEYNIKNILIHWATAISIILLLFELPHTYNKMVKSLNEDTVKEEKEIIDIISKHKTYSQWIVTDRPIFAFYANMLVPPELALVSHKRNFSSPCAQEYFIKNLKQYNPALILLNNPKYYGHKTIAHIENNYVNIFKKAVPPRVWSSKSLRTYPKGPYSLFKDFITNPWFIKKAEKNKNYHPIKQTTSIKLYSLTIFESLLNRQIASYSKLKKNQLFNFNRKSIYPININKDGTFKTKNYRFIKADCLKNFPTKQDKIAAYKLIKKEIGDWKKGQRMPENKKKNSELNSIVSRLNSLKNKVLEDITQEKKRIYLKTIKTIKNKKTLKSIKLYLRKDILPLI